MTTPEDRALAFSVTPEPNTRLGQLAALYDAYKDAADAAADQLKSITDAIKTELTKNFQRTNPEQPYTKYVLASEHLRAPLSLTYTVSTRLDTKAIKAAFPRIEQEYGKVTGSWTLKRASR